MRALVTGVNQLIQGEVYALPSYPCQILSDQYVYVAKSSGGPYTYLLESIVEPGIFADGGFVQSAGANSVVVIKKHTIGKSNAATSYSAAILMDKPSYYWRLSDPSGTTALERVSGLHGTISGGVTLAQPGSLVDGDKCMVFDGVSARILTGAASIPIPFTIEAWIRTSDMSTTERAYITIMNASGTYIGTYVGKVNHYNGAGGIASNRVIADGQWHHIALIYDSSTSITLYIDGIWDKTVTTPTITAFSQSIELGYRTAAGSASTWNGAIDEVAIYPYALSPAQISQHYKARSSPFIADSYASKVIASGPSNYWRLGETYGTVAKDVIGGADGTANNGVILSGENGMTFDGADDNISVSPTVQIPILCTIEGWLKHESSSAMYPILSTWIAGATGDTITVGSDNARQPLCVLGNNILQVNGAQFIIVNQWNHLVFILNGTTVVFYVNGVAAGSGAFARSVINSGGATYMGWFSGIMALTGSIKDVAIYPRALSAAEILDHYRAR